MNDSLWLDPTVSLRLCLTLLHSLWQLALLAAFAWLGDRVWRRSVERRYVMHVTALLAGLVALPVTFALVDGAADANIVTVRPDTPSPPQAAVATSVPETVVADGLPTAGQTVSETPPIAASSPAAVTPGDAATNTGETWEAAVRWIAALYALGVLGMLVRLASALSAAQRQMAGATKVAAGPVADMVSALARNWSLRVVPVVAIAEKIIIPQVVGLWRPMILLPASALSGLSVDELQMILAHELTHVRRHDLWVNLLQRLAETVLFFNPALWYLSRRISSLREFCCDELTCRTLAPTGPAPRTRYAAALLRVAELSCPSQATASELAALAATGRSPSELRRRIAHLFGEPVREPLMLSRGSLLVIVTGIALLLISIGWTGARSDSVEAAEAPPASPALTNQEREAVGMRSERETFDPSHARITGVVVDEQGQRMAEARISTLERPGEVASAVSDADGFFVLELASPTVGLTTVKAQSKTGDLLGLHQFQDQSNSKPEQSIRIVLKDAQRVTVNVADAEGRPVPDAAVEAIAFYKSLEIGSTDANGTASLLLPRDAKVNWIFARKSEVGCDYFANYTEHPILDVQTLPETVSLVLAGSRTVQVHALSGADPLPDLPITVWFVKKIGQTPSINLGGSRAAIVSTDSRGIADFDWLPADTEGVVSFLPRSTKYHLPAWANTSVSDPGADVTMQLVPTVRLSGRVVHQDGRPAAGIMLQAESRGAKSGRHYARTSSDGTYTIDAYPDQSYIIAVLDRHWAAKSLTGVVTQGGEPIDGLDLQLLSGTVIRGTVTFPAETRPELRTVTLIQVVDGGEENLVQWTHPDEAGNYSFRVGPGTYTLKPGSPKSGSLTVADEPEIVIDHATETPTEQTGGKQSDANANAAPRFELLVVDPQGEPVPKARVELRISPAPTEEQILVGEFIQESNYGPIACTDEDGRLVFMRAAEMRRFQVNITTPGYGPYWAEWSSDEHPEAIPTQFTAELETAWSVGGVVVDEQGAPIAGAQVRPSIRFKKRPGDDEQLGVGTRLTTDAAGAWWFDSVPDAKSKVWVEVSQPDYAPHRLSLTRAGFGVPPGQTPTAAITLTKGLTVTGRVSDEDGLPIAGALLRTKFMNDLREAYTDANGDYRLVGCEPRTVRLVVSAAGRATDMQLVRPDPDLGSVNFTMRPGGHVRVRVVDEQGRGIPRARIFFQQWRGGINLFEWDHINQYADENGVWEWNEAPVDEFKADICRPDGMQLTARPLVPRAEEYLFAPPRALVVSGKVVDAATKQPIPKFRVVPGFDRADPQSRTHWATYDGFDASEGAYEVRLTREEQAHYVRIEADGYEIAVSRALKSDEEETAVNFELQPAADVEAAILTADGQPAAGAKVVLAHAGTQVRIRNGAIDDGPTFATRLQAGDDGVFRFPARNEPYHLVVTHPSGYAWLKSAEQSIPTTITLTPWARIEGVFRVGAQPAKDMTLTFDTLAVYSYGPDLPTISTEHVVTTGPGGHFVFERVVPGEGVIGRNIPYMWNEGATEVMSSKRIKVHAPAGETTTLNLGGDGRAVVARLSPTSDAKHPVLWNIAMVSLHVGGPLPPQPTPPDDVRNDEARLKKWGEEWYRSSAGKEWRQKFDAIWEHRASGPQIQATVDRDGAFRIDDVPPGDYVLDVRFNLGEPGLDRSAGTLLEFPITVPPAENLVAAPPVDLGVLQLQ